MAVGDYFVPCFMTSSFSHSPTSCMLKFSRNLNIVSGTSSVLSRFLCSLFSPLLSIALPTHDVREIGRKLALCGDFPGFGMNLTCVSFQLLGSTPFSQALFMCLLTQVVEESVIYSTTLTVSVGFVAWALIFYFL